MVADYEERGDRDVDETELSTNKAIELYDHTLWDGVADSEIDRPHQRVAGTIRQHHRERREVSFTAGDKRANAGHALVVA